ncbi:hypothetical protein [Serinicoccus sediminis]|uniref:hypothetical protein n=1 Tax=Serinicoccus sediminis TaxID=2306021 RepID=UPI00101FCC3E|nr:hypothetical protein [Serinicoccus sediminis]
MGEVFYLVVVPVLMLGMGVWTYRSLRTTDSQGAAAWVWDDGSVAQVFRAVFVCVVALSLTSVLVISWVVGFGLRGH